MTAPPEDGAMDGVVSFVIGALPKRARMEWARAGAGRALAGDVREMMRSARRLKPGARAPRLDIEVAIMISKGC